MFRTNPYFGGGLVVQRGPFNEPLLKTKTKTRMSMKPNSYITIINPHRIDGSAPPPKMSRPVTRNVVDRPYPVNVGRPTPGRRLPLPSLKMEPRPDLAPIADEFIDEPSSQTPAPPLPTYTENEPADGTIVPVSYPRFETEERVVQAEQGMPTNYTGAAAGLLMGGAEAVNRVTESIGNAVGRVAGNAGTVINTVSTIGRLIQPDFFTATVQEAMIRAIAGQEVLNGVRIGRAYATTYIHSLRDALFTVAGMSATGLLGIASGAAAPNPDINPQVLDLMAQTISNTIRQNAQVSLRRLVTATLPIAIQQMIPTATLPGNPNSMVQQFAQGAGQSFGAGMFNAAVGGITAGINSVVQAFDAAPPDVQRGVMQFVQRRTRTGREYSGQGRR
jgi:hypothetical protein